MAPSFVLDTLLMIHAGIGDVQDRAQNPKNLAIAEGEPRARNAHRSLALNCRPLHHDFYVKSE